MSYLILVVTYTNDCSKFQVTSVTILLHKVQYQELHSASPNSLLRRVGSYNLPT